MNLPYVPRAENPAKFYQAGFFFWKKEKENPATFYQAGFFFWQKEKGFGEKLQNIRSRRTM